MSRNRSEGLALGRRWRRVAPRTSIHRARRLEKVQSLLADRPEAALKNAWRAATAAARQRDDSMLTSLGDLAREAQQKVSGKMALDARQLARFCEEAIEDNRLWRSDSSKRTRFFRRSGDFKNCPDCAETILLAANVCRFCGYRFDESQPSRI